MPNIALMHSADKPIVSRDFLIRQSILNALSIHFPWGLQQFGAAHVLRRISAAPLTCCNFAAETVIEFRKLTGTYSQVEEDELEMIGRRWGML